MKKTIDTNKFKIVAEFVLYFCFFALLGNAKIFGLLKPFQPSLLFAFVWCNKNILKLAVAYVGASLVFGISLFNLVPTVFTVLFLIIVGLIYKKLKKKLNLLSLICFFVISQIGKFIIVDSKIAYFVNVAEIVIGIIALLCYSTFFQALLLRKSRIKLNSDEKCCGCILAVSLFCGISRLKFLGFNFGIAISIFIILLFIASFGLSKSIVFSSMVGVGFFLATQNFSYLTSFVLLSLMAGLFCENKFLCCTALLLLETVLGVYFNLYGSYTYINFIAVLIPCLCFILFSKGLILEIKTYFSNNFKESEKFLLDVSRKYEFLKLNDISRIFAEMDAIYKQMLKKQLSKQEGCFLLSQELKNRNCDDCPNKNICFRKSGQDMLNVFYNIFSVGLEKKKLSIIDIPNNLSAKCNKDKILLNDANNLLLQYINYNDMLGGINTSRLLISDQMASVSKVIKEIAKDCKKEFKFNKEMEEKIEQELIYNNITNLLGVVVLENENYSIILNTIDEILNLEKAIKIIEKVCKRKFELREFNVDEGRSQSFYYFVQSPECDLVFGHASCSKNNQLPTGDAHTFQKIDTGKYLIGVCDGMGSGEVANQLCNQTINLIENFYKAGFESDSIISNINKLFMAGNEEKFSALDVCVLNLKNLQADFIKMGAPNTFIKKGENVEIVNGGGLPMGVLEEMKPCLEKKMVNPKDIIVMVSDGVSDCFENADELANNIKSQTSVNPQEIAQRILDVALDRLGGEVKDDMTVFVSRVFRKV